MERTVDPDVIRQHPEALIEISYTSKQSGKETVIRGSWNSVDVRDEGSYRVEVYDDVKDRLVIGDTSSKNAKNHRLMVLGDLLRIECYAPVG